MLFFCEDLWDLDKSGIESEIALSSSYLGSSVSLYLHTKYLQSQYKNLRWGTLHFYLFLSAFVTLSDKLLCLLFCSAVIYLTSQDLAESVEAESVEA